MANFTALTVARNTNAGYDVRHAGVAAAPGPPTAYASTEVHSCNPKAIETLGLGSGGLRLIPVRDDYTLDLEATFDIALNGSVSLQFRLVNKYDSLAESRGARDNNDGRFFVSRTATGGNTRVTEHLVTSDPNVADPTVVQQIVAYA